MTVTATAVGREILYTVEPTDSSIYKEVGPKLMEETELRELALGEGWPSDILDPAQRTQLAYRALEKLKVIDDKKKHRLELYNYPESKLLTVALQIPGKADKIIGSVEISEFLTLNDLRTVLAYELDQESLPRGYQFIYKGTPCAIRQEYLRRAWELLPKVTISTKAAYATANVEVKVAGNGNGNLCNLYIPDSLSLFHSFTLLLFEFLILNQLLLLLL